MTEVKAKILLVEEDLDFAEVLTAYFRGQEYEIITVNHGEAGVRAAQEFQPDLLILDIRLRGTDGFEVARRIRASWRVRPIPIIFMTEMNERANRLQGQDLGSEDYIPKPFEVQELMLRVSDALRRAKQDSLKNPITNLPDGQLVNERFSKCLTRTGWAALLISLDNLDYFREAYGFVASNDVLRAVGLVIANIVREVNCPEDFIGHVSPTDFVLLTTQEALTDLKARICNRIEQSLDYFYPIKDREQTTMHGKRLALQTGVIQYGDALYTSAIELKTALLQKKV